MQLLKREGLIAPEEISHAEDKLPFDFTKLNSRELGAVHSRYAVRHSHAIYVAATLASKLAWLKRDYKIEQAVFRARHKDDYGPKYELDDAMIKDERISELADRIIQREAELEIVNALAEGYDGFRAAASREMYRRGMENAPKD